MPKYVGSALTLGLLHPDMQSRLNTALVLLAAFVAVALSACTGPSPLDGGAGNVGDGPAAPQGPGEGLTALDVALVVEQAARSVSNDISIAVVDRVGNILGVFRRGGTPDNDEIAVSLARTGAFFSHDQGPLSSELVRFLSRENFPEAVQDTPAADLFGIELTNRGCPLTGGPLTFPYLPGQAVPPSTNIAGTGPGVGITTRPGGFPLYKQNRMVGGVGVFGAGDAIDEFAGLTGTTGFTLAAPSPGKILLEGIELPFLTFDGSRPQGSRPPGTVPGDFPGTGAFRAGIPGIVIAGTRASPIVAPPFAPEGYLIGPNPGSLLSVTEVDSIVQAAITSANRTRAAIRLPPGQRTRMCIAVAEGVGNANVSKGALLALFRMPDATIFSLDVAASKARNVIYFSAFDRDPNDLPLVAPGIAVTNRTIGFGAQTMYPSGIKVSDPGPFRSLFLFDQANPCTQGVDPNNTFPDANKSGIVFFPGSTALYKGGTIVAGLGVSGDGVAQDDVVTDAGAQPYLPVEAQRADTLIVRGVRLPYFKFSRNPEQ